jgi:hypothetical protein
LNEFLGHQASNDITWVIIMSILARADHISSNWTTTPSSSSFYDNDAGGGVSGYLRSNSDGGGNILENYYDEDDGMFGSTRKMLSAATSTILPTIAANLTTRSAKDIAAEILRRPLPEELLHMSPDSRNCVIAYVILFLIGAPGNLSIFVTVGREIWRRQLMRSRIKVLIWHLATADLFVCFVVIPIEVFWRITVQWYGGDALCRISQFFRAFGLYLSSMVIICISLDRFFAIVFPLKVIGGMKRVRNMLWLAWCSAILFATPQVRESIILSTSHLFRTTLVFLYAR